MTLLLIPVASSLAGCGDDMAACNGVLTTSSVTNNHTHTLCVDTADLTTPPAGGKQFTTSTTGGHFHTVTLTQSQLQMINNNMSVMVTSSGPNEHTFLIRR